MPVIMKLEEPQVQQAQALVLGCLDLGLLLSTRWRGWKGPSLGIPWQPHPHSSRRQQVPAAGDPRPRQDAQQHSQQRKDRPWSRLRRAVSSAVASPLLPAVGLGVAAAAALGAAASGACGAVLRWLADYAAAELGFQGYQCWRYAIANAYPEAPPHLADMGAVMERFFQLSDVIDLRDFLSGWFHGVPFESIRRGNTEEFIAYGFYCTTYDRLTPAQRAATGAFIDRAEAVWGVRFPPGTNPDIAPMRHLWEPLRVLPKPLALYLLSEVAGVATRIMLRRQGYMRSVSGGFAVWLRPPAAQQRHRQQLDVHERGDSACSGPLGGSGRDCRAARPLVFLHGVGLGLFPYMRFVRMLAEAAPHHPVVLAEARHVALRLCGTSPTIDELAHAVVAMLARHGLQEACIVGHSYGTFAASRIRQLYPEVVHSLALMDPVCMMTCSPHLLRNFIYTSPRLDWRAPTMDAAMDAARYICSRDLMVAAAFCRRFHWQDLMLWPEQLPPGATVVALSTNDDLVPVPLVQAQLAASSSDARVLVHPTAGHGGFLVDLPFQERVVAEVQNLLLATGEKL